MWELAGEARCQSEPCTERYWSIVSSVWGELSYTTVAVSTRPPTGSSSARRRCSPRRQVLARVEAPAENFLRAGEADGLTGWGVAVAGCGGVAESPTSSSRCSCWPAARRHPCNTSGPCSAGVGVGRLRHQGVIENDL